MRALTAAQLREIQSFPTVRIVAASATTGFYYTTYPDTDASYGFYESGMALDDYEIEIDPVGGMSTIGDLQINILNAEDAMAFVKPESSPAYIENDEITLTLLVNDTAHTLYSAVVSEWTVDSERWVINITDETNKYNSELLTEITAVNYPDTYDETIGLFIPLLYADEGGSGAKFPAYNVNKGYFKLLFANHTITNAGAGSAYIYAFEESIETYALLVNVVSQSDNISGTAYVRYYDADFRLGNYSRMIISSRTDSSFALTFHRLLDNSTSTSISMGENLKLGFQIDIGDLGYIYNSTDVDIYVISTARTGSPAIQQYALDNTTSYSSQTISSDSFLYNSTPKAGGGTWQFSDFTNYDFEIVTTAAEAITVQDVYVNLTYRKYSRTPKRIITRIQR